MSEYRVSNVLPIAATNIREGIYVVLYNATHTPPHILLSVYGKYFSLSVFGLKSKEDCLKILSTAEKKKSKLLFIELKDSALFIEKENALRVCDYVFSGYGEIEETTKTCLFPVRDSLEEMFNRNFSSCEYVFQLYENLIASNLVKGSYQLFMDDECKEGNFIMNTYTLEDINKSIAQFRNTVLADANR